MNHAQRLAALSLSSLFAALIGCGSSEDTASSSASGGASSRGGATSSGLGGNSASGGTGFGGVTNSAGMASGGASAGEANTNGGALGVGGATGGTGTQAGAANGGATSQGGSATGGAIGIGGATGNGGSTNGGNASGGATTGGATSNGGMAATGGTTSNGGSTANGGGTATGGVSASGGATSNGCPVKLEGWATTNANGVNGTTGGGNATPTTVTTFAALKAAAQDSAPRVIIVSGTIKTTDGGGSAMAVASNKTLIGANKSATIYGGISMNGVNNVIIRNLNIQGVYPNSGPDDTVASHNSHHIWYDHLAIWDAGDGLLDITNQSNYQTVSWTKFYYTNSANGHRLASLNGSGGGDHPEDSGYLKVTYHHNWWSTLVHERMPRVMYGQGHSYNNYFNAPGNLYCIGVGSFGSALIENNYFKDVKDPHIFMYALHAYITATGNVYDNTSGDKSSGLGGTGTPSGVNAAVPDAAPFTPPYGYALDKAADVPSLVQKCAGPQ